MRQPLSFFTRRLALSILLSVGSVHASTVPVWAAEGGPPAREKFISGSPYLTAMVYSALVSLNDANLTNDYSVFLKRLATSSQSKSSQEKLSAGFQVFRDKQIDLTPAVLYSPDWKSSSGISNGVLRLVGALHSQPQEILFDLSYVQEGGKWRLAAIAVNLAPPAKQRSR